MPRFTYDYCGEQSEKNTHAKRQTYTEIHTTTRFFLHMCTWAHHLLAAGYNEIEDGLCQWRDGMTRWLYPAGFDPVSSSSSSSQPTQPLPSAGPERRSPNLDCRVELETLFSLLWAPFSASGSEPCPAPPPEQDQILALQRAWQRGWVCVRACMCEALFESAGWHPNTSCVRRIYNFILVSETSKVYASFFKRRKSSIPSPETIMWHSHCHGNTGLDKHSWLQIASI